MTSEKYLAIIRHDSLIYQEGNSDGKEGYLLGYRDGIVRSDRNKYNQDVPIGYWEGWEDGYGDILLAELYVSCDL